MLRFDLYNHEEIGVITQSAALLCSLIADIDMGGNYGTIEKF